MNRHHQDYNPIDQRRLAIIQTSVKKPAVKTGGNNLHRVKKMVVVVVVVVVVITITTITVTIITKKNDPICHLLNIAILEDHGVKIKVDIKIDNYLDLARGLKKLWNKVDSDTKCNWYTNNFQTDGTLTGTTT